MFTLLNVPVSKVIGWIPVVQSLKLKGFLYYNPVKSTLCCGYHGQRDKNAWNIPELPNKFTKLRLGVG
jgi:hypothetical protein